MKAKKTPSTKPSKTDVKPCDCEGFTAIGTVAVSCAAGTSGTKNVTVTASGVSCPLASASSCVAQSVMATLFRNGVSVMSQQMFAISPTSYTTMFMSQPSGTYSATVTVNWQIITIESATSGNANCN